MQAYSDFLSQDQYLPQRHFLTGFLTGLLVAKSPMLTDILRAGEGFPAKLPGRVANYDADTKREMDTREHYLSRNLASPRLYMNDMLDRYYEKIEPILTRDDGRGVTIVVDGTDFRKESAQPDHPRGMQGATYVRDGSRSTKAKADLAMGFPGVTVEAVLGGGNSIPLAHWIYSREEADPLAGRIFLSELQATEYVLQRVASHVGSRAWWTFDRGYASRKLFGVFDTLHLRWLCRIQTGTALAGSRHVEDQIGLVHKISKLVESVKLPYTHPMPGGDVEIHLGLQKVFLCDEQGVAETVARTLMVGQIGSATRFAFMASEWLGDRGEVADMLRSLYKLRWTVEEVHRHMKDRNGFGFALETFRVLKFRSIQRMGLLAMLAAGFTALTQAEAEAEGDITKQTAGSRTPRRSKKRPVKNFRYQLTEVLGRALESSFIAWWKERARRRVELKRRRATPGELAERAKRSLANAIRAVTRRKRELAAALRRVVAGG